MDYLGNDPPFWPILFMAFLLIAVFFGVAIILRLLGFNV